MATNVTGDLLSQNYELQNKFNELFRQIRQDGGYPFNFGRLMIHLQMGVEGNFLSPIGKKHYPKFSKKLVNGGYTIEVLNEGTSYETILSIETSGGNKYSLNDEVVFKRDMFSFKEGDKGIIITILEPHKDGHSNDILVVKFGEEICHLKTKEINLV